MKNTSLVIVESPAKARTIGKFLGDNYVVEASIGHIRDLPKNTKEIPEKYKKEKWSRLGVNVDSNFEPIYVIPDDKRKQMKKLSDLLKNAKEVYLATDEDREGEAISWHLVEVLQPQVPVHRLVFHEITRQAIDAALKSPRKIDENLVHAQETRRIVDRLYGYEVSPLLWYKVRPKLSAGRVQSVAVRLIVERERERIAFHSATYWDLFGSFATKAGARPFQAGLISVGGKKIPAGKDFSSDTGKLTKPEQFILLDEPAARALVERLRNKSATVKSVEDKPYTERPYAPFTTSTLQQEANRKFGSTARTTMSLAQSLYENGHITYMRTDSTNLSGEAINAARKHIQTQYGKEYLPDSPRIYKTNVKNAQEAHEAIRPAGSVFDLPEQLRSRMTFEEFRLYDLIWKRTVASQMADARGMRKQLVVELDDALFSVGGKTIEFPGYLRAYVEGSDDPEADLADREVLLPNVKAGDPLTCRDLQAKSHTTAPPSRYSEAALTKMLTDKGIGRPSTYASIIETILNRNYVFKKGGALVPTWVAFAVSKLLEQHLPDLINYDFTAQMEDQLDAISRGELGHQNYLKDFYFGAEHPGLKKQLDHKVEEIDARDVSTVDLGTPTGGEPIVVRIGKFGPYLQQGERKGSIPEDLPPDELTIEKALHLLNKSEQSDDPLGICPETGKPIFVKNGRFGPYIQRGTTDDEEKPQNASLLKGMSPEEVDLETALKLLSLPRNLGVRPTDGAEVVAQNGRYGPYVQCGKDTRSLPDGVSPFDVNLDQALELLSQPKYKTAKGAGGARKTMEPLKQFDDSPVTGKPIKLLSGRFGNYVTDGETNATLPKSVTIEELTFDRALNLLAERAAKGPSKKQTVRKKAAPKKAVVKKTPKKTTKKKTAKKA